MIKQIDYNTRLKTKFHIPAVFCVAICLQRRKWYGWKTVSWVYPSIMEDKDFDHIVRYLELVEDKTTSEWQRKIAKSLFEKF